MRVRLLLIVLVIAVVESASIKTLASSCFCDVSTSCDAYCCCDNDCSSTLVKNWNNYTLCASDGYAIPLCSYYYNEPLHTHDLYQGLRLIYTIIKRLFCISKVNFVDPSTGFVSSTTDSQISIPSTTTSAISANVLGLSSLANYVYLPLKSSSGICGQYTLRDMNTIQDDSCRAYLSSTSSISTNPYLSLSQFISNNNLASISLIVYQLSSPSAPLQTVLNASSTSSSCTGTKCYVIKQIKLNFIKTSSSVTVDYNSSYIVMGHTYVNGPTYVSIKYSYQFISQVGNFPYSSTVGYSKGSLLSFVKSSNSTYYKIFNPVNLAFASTDCTCRSSSSDSDQSSLISFRFGVNSVYTCLGSSNTLFATNIKAAFDYVGALGSSSTNLSDFVLIDYTSSIGNNQNIQLLFSYASIGTQLNPQYQITKAVLNPIASTSNGLVSLYVEYMPVSNSLVLNLPSPPIVDAYLPNDFLYPFYVA